MMPLADVPASGGAGQWREWWLEARAAAGGGGGAARDRGRQRLGWRLVAGALLPGSWPRGWKVPQRGAGTRPLAVRPRARPDQQVKYVKPSQPERLSGVGIV